MLLSSTFSTNEGVLEEKVLSLSTDQLSLNRFEKENSKIIRDFVLL